MPYNENQEPMFYTRDNEPVPSPAYQAREGENAVQFYKMQDVAKEWSDYDDYKNEDRQFYPAQNVGYFTEREAPPLYTQNHNPINPINPINAFQPERQYQQPGNSAYGYQQPIQENRTFFQTPPSGQQNPVFSEQGMNRAFNTTYNATQYPPQPQPQRPTQLQQITQTQYPPQPPMRMQYPTQPQQTTQNNPLPVQNPEPSPMEKDIKTPVAGEQPPRRRGTPLSPTATPNETPTPAPVNRRGKPQETPRETPQATPTPAPVNRRGKPKETPQEITPPVSVNRRGNPKEIPTPTVAKSMTSQSLETQPVVVKQTPRKNQTNTYNLPVFSKPEKKSYVTKERASSEKKETGERYISKKENNILSTLVDIFEQPKWRTLLVIGVCLLIVIVILSLVFGGDDGQASAEALHFVNAIMQDTDFSEMFEGMHPKYAEHFAASMGYSGVEEAVLFMQGAFKENPSTFQTAWEGQYQKGSGKFVVAPNGVQVLNNAHVQTIKNQYKEKGISVEVDKAKVIPIQYKAENDALQINHTPLFITMIHCDGGWWVEPMATSLF